MLISENRERIEWLLQSFLNFKRGNEGLCDHDLKAKFLDGEIAMEKGWRECADAAADVRRRNKRLLRAIRRTKGYSFYKRLLDVIEQSEGIREFFLAEIVREPIGDFVKEKYGRQIDGYWVDQRTVGTEGDSFEGTICVQVKPNKYFKFHYSM